MHNFKEYVVTALPAGLTNVLPWLNFEVTMIIVSNLHSELEIASHATLINFGSLFHFIAIGSANSINGFIGNAAGEGNV